MCGICGVFALDGELDTEIREALPHMTFQLRHRGPDGQHVFADSVAALGHRRLSIIDVAGGRQPMSNEDGSVWVVFNGEIYNHHDLRQRLRGLGHTFKTASDTEVIVHAYEQFGDACVDLLSGMFAFAIYDARQRELFLARDRAGKKPMYYATLRGHVHFASEIKALAASPAWTGELDLSGLPTYLSFGYLLGAETPFAGIRKLEPGHFLRFHAAGTTGRRYWDIAEFDSAAGSDDELASKIEHQLSEAVAARLESEVPLGAFLSGGIDSGLVVSMMADADFRDVVTTSVGFDGDSGDELEAAALTAARFSDQHYAEKVTAQLGDVLPNVVAGFDEPFADASAVPTYHVAQMARRHVTVALTGDGGDEAFAGYDFRYLPHAREDKIRRFLPGRRLLGGQQLAVLWPGSSRLPRPLRLKSVLRNLGSDPAGAYAADLCFATPFDVERLLGAGHSGSLEAAIERVRGIYDRCPSPDAVQKAEYADFHVYLADDVLTKVDRMTMQHGLEVRSPFLDHHVVELAFRIPARRKLNGSRSKHLLREIARRRLPEQLVSLPKRGFHPPTADWLKDPRTGLQDLLGEPGALLKEMVDTRAVSALWHECSYGSPKAEYLLWALCMFESWLRYAKSNLTQRNPVKA